RLDEEARLLAQALIKKFDSNGDGQVDRQEAPEAFRRFAFDKFDKDGNETINIEEAINFAKMTLLKKNKQRDRDERL
ncbi:MAG: hypothetical protein N2C12_05505, partial [Planctomycetales bacterium]